MPSQLQLQDVTSQRVVAPTVLSAVYPTISKKEEKKKKHTSHFLILRPGSAPVVRHSAPAAHITAKLLSVWLTVIIHESC